MDIKIIKLKIVSLKTISLLHPFTAKAIGLSYDDILYSHSKPHVVALRNIADDSFLVTIDYFTTSILPIDKVINGIKKKFWKIDFSLKKNQFRNQFSKVHFNSIKSNSPNLIIINTSGFGGKYVFELAKYLKSKNTPYVAMIGGINMAYDGAAYQYYKNANHIIVHTEAQKKNIQAIKTFTDFDIRVLPLGIDTSVFKPNNSKKSIEGKLLFVGRITRLKQVEIAIDTLKYILENGFKNASLTIIGPTSDKEYFNELKVQIEKLKIEKKVFFLGSIHQENLINYYQNTDLLLLPSKTESFGMVMIEAMSCETPVGAIIGAGAADEIIENANNGILSAKDEYPKSIFEALNNTISFEKLKLNARKTVIEKYSIEETTRVLKKSINDCLA